MSGIGPGGYGVMRHGRPSRIAEADGQLAPLWAENERLRRRVEELEVQLANEGSKVLKWEIKCADEGKRVAGEIADWMDRKFLKHNDTASGLASMIRDRFVKDSK